MSDDSTFKPLSNPVASVMARLLASVALDDADRLRETARATGNDTLIKQSAQRLMDYERHAEESQYFA
jgi:hypothetical protein